MSELQVFQADLTLVEDRFEEGVHILIDERGVIEQVGALDLKPTRLLTGQAILPGFVNAHSHAFQRGLRGIGDVFPSSAGRAGDPPVDDFWTWRQAMYDLVSGMDADRLYAWSRQAFEEMLAGGITTVGEFHYLHHDDREAGYAFDDVVLHAARDAGIRIVLLNTLYQTGGVGQPLSPAQKRFQSRSLKEYWSQMDRLAARIDDPRQSLGVVAHSVRAVPIDALAELHRESRRRDLPFHIHLEEQPQEIEACRKAHGCAPMALINDRLDIDDRFTAVHCTHTDPEDMKRFARNGGRVCLCPLTEANLGDGISDAPGMIEAGVRLCVGTDLNSRLCMAEELRLLEYGQRLRRQRRGVLADAQGRVAWPLFQMATRHGGESLGLKVGAIEAGYLADFMTLNLAAPSLKGWTPERLLDAFIFGSGLEAVGDICLNGQWKTFPNSPR